MKIEHGVAFRRPLKRSLADILFADLDWLSTLKAGLENSHLFPIVRVIDKPQAIARQRRHMLPQRTAGNAPFLPRDEVLHPHFEVPATAGFPSDSFAVERQAWPLVDRRVVSQSNQSPLGSG